MRAQRCPRPLGITACLDRTPAPAQSPQNLLRTRAVRRGERRVCADGRRPRGPGPCRDDDRQENTQCLRAGLLGGTPAGGAPGALCALRKPY